MYKFPLLPHHRHSRFANPLAGLVYDNRQYEQSCFGNLQQLQSLAGQSHPSYANSYVKSKSIPCSLNKLHPRPERKKQSKPEPLLKSSKALNTSQRLSSPLKQRCSRNKWVSVDQTSASQYGLGSRSLLGSTKLERSEGSLLAKDEPRRFKYPEIQVSILDSLSQGREELRSVRLGLKRYFQAFFKDSLQGLVFSELADLVERHIEQAIKRENAETTSQFSDQTPIFTSKRTLYQKLSECQRLDRLEELHTLVRLYCLPKPELRAIFLLDVSKILGLQFYQEFGFSKDIQYALMTPQGCVIQDFAEIKFSTTKVFAANKVRARESYQQYVNHVKCRQMYNRRFTFRETLKNNFREQVDGHYDDRPSPPRQEGQEEKRSNLSRAQKIINFKNNKTSYGRVRLIQYLQKQKEGKDQEGKGSVSKEKRVEEHRTDAFVDEKIQQEFKKLKRVCDYKNADFKNDQTCKNKILLRVLLKQNVYFRTKTPAQLTKILEALELIDQGETIGHSSQRTMTLEEFVFMRRIINCNGDKQRVIHFVDRYLNYDEYGELQKDDLRETLAFVIGEADKKTSEIILGTIWGWLEKNGVITNDIVRRNHMQLQFERNKIVYYFLISLIFGTSDTTALELAQEVLL